MATVSYFAASRAVQRLAEDNGAQRLAIGSLALGMLMALEVAGAKVLRGMTLEEYLALQRSPSGAIFAAGLAWFAAAPLLV